MQGSIKGQVALVTGASSGIGEAVTWRLAELRCSLVLCARRADRLQSLKLSLEKQYEVDIHTVALDVTDLEAVQALLQNLPEKFQQVDILVNNAGLALGTAPVHKNDVLDSVKVINTNITAVTVLTKEFVPGMVQRNRGHVVNISSIAAHYTYPGGSVYCGSKHFIDAFTNAARWRIPLHTYQVHMQHDLVKSNIRVTSISPGAVQTEFSIVRYKGDEAKAGAVYDGIIPLNAADCADAVVYSLTRPPHVQIGEIVLYATNQSSPQSIARVLNSDASMKS